MKRRQFLGNTLKGGAALSLSALPLFHITRISQKPDKLGVALVGLGGYASGQLGPALKETTNCYLAGVVTGTESKIGKWTEEYELNSKNVYNYQNFDAIAENPAIDIVYVVLPNSMHKEFVIRAAKAGKHVICEKPMATTYPDAVAMVEACKKAGVKLSVGYRLHFEPYNLEIMRLGQKEVFGKVLQTEAGFAFPLRNKNLWRLDKQMAGGGPLMDVGIYSIQSTIYTLGQLPTSLIARDTTQDVAFYGAVEGSMECEFKYPTPVKSLIKTSYEEAYCFTRGIAEKGSFELQPAYYYGGLAGKTSTGSMNFPSINQQAKQMDDFAAVIKNDSQSIVRGEMGARDLFIIDKIYESIALGKEVPLAGIPNILHKV